MKLFVVTMREYESGERYSDHIVSRLVLADTQEEAIKFAEEESYYKHECPEIKVQDFVRVLIERVIEVKKGVIL